MTERRPAGLCRLRAALRGYVECEIGSATIWNVTWLLAFAGMAGLSIDASNGWRNKSMLQSTADVAALAGAMSLPNLEYEAGYETGAYGAVEEAAEQFALDNMGSEYGAYFDPTAYPDDIRIGNWNWDDRIFTEGGAPVNAVRVEHAQVRDRENGVSTSLMHMVGMEFWDVRTTAIAARGLDPCVLNGIVAREELSLNATKMQISGDVCMHGQLGAFVAPGGAWHQEELLSIGDHKPTISNPWTVQGSQYDLIDGEVGTEDIAAEMQDENDYMDRFPPMVDQIVEIGWSMMAGIDDYRHFPYPSSKPGDAPPTVVLLPNNISEIASTDPDWTHDGTAGSFVPPPADSTMVIDYHPTYRYTDGVHTQSGNNSSTFQWPMNSSDIEILQEVVVDGEARSVTWTGDYSAGTPSSTTGPAILPEHRIYFADRCKGGNDGTLNLTGHIKNVTIVTNCKIDIAGSAWIENAVLLTTATGPTETSEAVKQTVSISNGAQIGSTCTDWGNVRIYSNGDIGATVPKNSDIAASTFYGVQLVARRNIQFAARADMSRGMSMLAGGQIDIQPQAVLGAILAEADQSGCPTTDGTEFEYDAYAYMTSLVQ